jgi:hypothetical protein
VGEGEFHRLHSRLQVLLRKPHTSDSIAPYAGVQIVGLPEPLWCRVEMELAFLEDLVVLARFDIGTWNVLRLR